MEAHFDNSAENPANPHSPPKVVSWGEQTTDEMCIGIFEFVVAEDGDPRPKPGKEAPPPPASRRRRKPGPDRARRRNRSRPDMVVSSARPDGLVSSGRHRDGLRALHPPRLQAVTAPARARPPSGEALLRRLETSDKRIKMNILPIFTCFFPLSNV